jgi:hypothetical protein
MTKLLPNPKKGRKRSELALAGVKESADDPMSYIGRPISFKVRDAGFQHVRDMGITDTSIGVNCVNEVANLLERDKPFEAMHAGMKYLDLTGVYRLFAVLLCSSMSESKVEIK